MLRIGVTGGIGSGKTTVCRAFASLGVPVYDSDTNAKLLMSSDQGLIDGIKLLLGEQAYCEGALDKVYIASKIFNDKELLAKMNALVHPAVMRDFERWAQLMSERKVPYVIQENAIFFEGGFDVGMDHSVTVSVPLEQRIERASSRDGVSPNKVRERIAHQMSDGEKEARADYVLRNGEQDLLLPQILELHRIFTDVSGE